MFTLTRSIAAAIVMACTLSSRPLAQELSPQEIHDRIVEIMIQNASRAIPAGDTFVTWSPNPVLYTTVDRTESTVASSLVRADGMVGTAEAVWRTGLQREVSVRWTRGDSTLLEFRANLDGSAIRLTGKRDTTLQAPTLPWVIADYGMEDQLLPLVAVLSTDTLPHQAAVYRPYATKWDTITIASARAHAATLTTVTNPDGEHFFWTITPAGALVRITRDRHPDVERRPLEMTPRVSDYVKMRALWSH